MRNKFATKFAPLNSIGFPSCFSFVNAFELAQMITMYKSRLVLAAVCCLIAFDAFSASDYRCVIANRISAGEESLALKKMQDKEYLGKEFTVDRRTGLMVGILKNSYLTKPQVIDSGSRDNSFKVINSLRLEEGLGSGTNIYALTINEYERFDKKGFVFLVNDTVYLGTCKHF
jgi:hypothetical protein